MPKESKREREDSKKIESVKCRDFLILIYALNTGAIFLELFLFVRMFVTVLNKTLSLTEDVHFAWDSVLSISFLLGHGLHFSASRMLCWRETDFALLSRPKSVLF